MIGALTSLEVTTLGRFEVRREQDPLSGGYWNRRKVCELFKLLISVEQHRLHREQIQEILWPSSASEQAASSFGKTLYLLRRALEPDLATGKGSSSTYIILDHDILLLIPDSIKIDVDIFEAWAKQLQVKLRGMAPTRTVKKSGMHETIELLDEFDRVLALYGGTYLPEDLYEDWTQRRRDRLCRIHSWLLENAAALAVTCAMGQRASEYLQALLEENPTDEQTHRQLILIYARMGRRSEALNRFHLLRELLREELSTDPLPETSDLYRAIQAGRITADLASPLEQVNSTITGPALTAQESVRVEKEAFAQERTLQLREAQDFPPPEQALQTVFVERDEELKRLQHAYSLACHGHQRVFVISGEPGIGKTRLAREFTRQVEAQQAATVLWGYCYEMAGLLPYQPIVDAIRAYVRTVSSEQLQHILVNYAADLAKIVPEIGTKLPALPQREPLGPEMERYHLYNAVAHFFATLVAERPTVIILDDLQWADTATMQLLNYLTSSAIRSTQPRAMPFYILLYRADEVHESHPLRELLTSLSRLRCMEEVRLRRLSEEAVQQLLVNLAGRSVPPEFVSTIYKHTEGNPFFIGETLISLVYEGLVRKVGDQWQTVVSLEGMVLPQSVRLLIERRLARISPECRTTLALAAVLGRQFSSTLLCEARQLSEDVIAEHVDEAIHLHILVSLDDVTNEYCLQDQRTSWNNFDLSFTHDQIREVLCQGLNPLRRRAMHRQAARAMETHYATHPQPYYNQLAYHYQMAEDYTQAIKFFLRAASHASGVYAFFDAAAYTEKALALLIGNEDRIQRAELLHQLAADVYIYLGRPDKALEAGKASYALWHDLNNVVKEAEARLAVAFALHWQGREVEAIECIVQVLKCLEKEPGERRLLARAHAQWGMAATNMGHTTIAQEQLQQADELHRHSGGNDPFIAVVTLWARSWYCFLAETPQQMLEYALRAAQVCRDTHNFAWEPMATYTVAWAYMLLGRIEEGKQIARHTLEQASRHNAVGAQGWANLVLEFTAIQQARWSEMQHYADKAQDIAKMLFDKDLQARVLLGLSIGAGRQGNWRQAIDDISEALQIVQQESGAAMIYPYLLVQAANAYFYAGQLERAQNYLDKGMHLAQERGYQQLPAVSWRVQGRILQAQGKFDEAQAYFERSLSETQELGDTLQFYRTLGAYGQFFLVRNREGDRECGQELIDRASLTFRRLQE
jgi:predicted ATPase/DNA-binding SARP family transcriptional activator